MEGSDQGAPPSTSAAVTDADRVFLRDEASQIPGWLGDYAALRTMELMRWQSGRGVRGPALEIGVYAGRYLAVICRETAAAGDLSFGLDTFARVSAVDALRTLDDIAPNRVWLLQGRSTDFNAVRIEAELGQPARFVSIDGSHMLNDVRHDLQLSNSILHDYGIVALDDFFNPIRMGVGQAAHEFLSRTTSLTPFAFVQGKLLLCRPKIHSELLTLMTRLILADRSGPGATFAAHLASDPSRTMTELYGWRLTVAP